MLRYGKIILLKINHSLSKILIYLHKDYSEGSYNKLLIDGGQMDTRKIKKRKSRRLRNYKVKYKAVNLRYKKHKSKFNKFKLFKVQKQGKK